MADIPDIQLTTEPEVGISYVEGIVRGPTGIDERVRFLIDSGAIYSLLPNAVWQRIGLQPKREERFSLADGTTVSRLVSECHITLSNAEGHSPVILGEQEDPEALLGVVTLETLGLVFDPFRRTLHPMRMLLMSAGSREHGAGSTEQGAERHT